MLLKIHQYSHSVYIARLRERSCFVPSDICGRENSFLRPKFKLEAGRAELSQQSLRWEFLPLATFHCQRNKKGRQTLFSAMWEAKTARQRKGRQTRSKKAQDHTFCPCLQTYFYYATFLCLTPLEVYFVVCTAQQCFYLCFLLCLAFSGKNDIQQEKWKVYGIRSHSDNSECLKLIINTRWGWQYCCTRKNIVHQFAISEGVGGFFSLSCPCRKRVACHYIKDISNSSRTVKALICVSTPYKG